MSEYILTQEKAKAYFDESANECPYCGSYNIRAEQPDCGSDKVWRDCSCENKDCLGTWKEEYELARIFNYANDTGYTKRQVSPTKDYKTWWHDVGSGIAKRDDEDFEEFARRITQIAWEDRMVLEEVRGSL